MTTQQLRIELETLVDSLGTSRLLVKYVFVLARGREHLMNTLQPTVYGLNRGVYGRMQQEARDLFADIRRQSDQFPVGRLFQDLAEVRESVQHCESVLAGGEARILRQLDDQLGAFYTALEANAGGDEKDFGELLDHARTLNPTLFIVRHSLAAVVGALGEDEACPRDRRRLHLQFPLCEGYTDVACKLPALERAYAELSALAGHAERDLEMVRLEASRDGGLDLVVDGAGGVMDMLVNLIDEIARFVYRRYDVGEIARRMPERVLATQVMVNLAAELTSTGLDSASTDDARLRDAAVILRRELATIIAGEPMVRVDGAEYGVDEDMRDAFRIESRAAFRDGTHVVTLNSRKTA